MALITHRKADKDVTENVVSNEVGTARNQDPNLEALLALATQMVNILEDLINRVLTIEWIPKTSMTYFTLGKESCTSQNDKQGEREIILKEKPNNQSNVWSSASQRQPEALM